MAPLTVNRAPLTVCQFQQNHGAFSHENPLGTGKIIDTRDNIDYNYSSFPLGK
jgi:hypothetical protein